MAVPPYPNELERLGNFQLVNRLIAAATVRTSASPDVTVHSIRARRCSSGSVIAGDGVVSATQRRSRREPAPALAGADSARPAFARIGAKSATGVRHPGSASWSPSLERRRAAESPPTVE